MKKLTNKLGLPEPLVRAIANDSYNPGTSDFTATGLIKPSQMIALEKKHAEEITEDASDLIYSLQGQSIHTILERAGAELRADGFIVEERYTSTFSLHTVSAQIDLYDSTTHTLSDYKVTSVYAVKDGVKEEYAIQLNIGAELLRRAGKEVKALQIVAILRDWSVGEYEREKVRCEAEGFKTKYPATQVSVLSVPIISSKEVVQYINERCKSHSLALLEGIGECSPEERWEKASKYAIVKLGAKKAYRLHDTKEAATLQASELKGYEVQYRQGESTRCLRYCKVRDFCPQFKAMNNKQGDK
jgi:hypothetical protein